MRKQKNGERASTNDSEDIQFNQPSATVTEEQQKPYNCSHCQKRYQSKYNLTYHLRNKHQINQQQEPNVRGRPRLPQLSTAGPQQQLDTQLLQNNFHFDQKIDQQQNQPVILSCSDHLIPQRALLMCDANIRILISAVIEFGNQTVDQKNVCISVTSQQQSDHIYNDFETVLQEAIQTSQVDDNTHLVRFKDMISLIFRELHLSSLPFFTDLFKIVLVFLQERQPQQIDKLQVASEIFDKINTSNYNQKIQEAINIRKPFSKSQTLEFTTFESLFNSLNFKIVSTNVLVAIVVECTIAYCFGLKNEKAHERYWGN